MEKEMLDNFYVYLHINPVTKEVFYVGKGNCNRAYAKTRRSKRWTSYINKYGYEVAFVKTEISDSEAIKLEIETIAKIGRIDTNRGPLINLTDGGEGAAGAVRSQESRDKIGNALRGRHLSEEHKEKLHLKNTGNKLNAEQKERQSNSLKESWKSRKPNPLPSDATKKRMSEAAKAGWLKRNNSL